MTNRQIEISEEETAPADTTEDAVYTGDEIAEQRSRENTDHSREYAQVVGLEHETEQLLLTVRCADGTEVTMELPMAQNGRLPDKTRQLFHHLGADIYEAAELTGATVPVRRTDDTVELALDGSLPDSNATRPQNTDADAAQDGAAQQFVNEAPFWSGLLAGVVAIGLAVPLVLSVAFSAVGASTGSIVAAVGVQYLIVGLLLARSVLVRRK